MQRIALLVFLVGLSALLAQSPYFAVDSPVRRWAHMFLNPNSHDPIHWWGGVENDPLAVYFLIAAGMILCRLDASANGHRVVFVQFALYLAGYVLFFDRYTMPRYIYYVLPVFTTLIASSCWQLVRSLRVVERRRIGIAGSVLIAAMLIVFFDVRNGYRVVERPALDAHDELHQFHFLATGEFHYLLGDLLMFFRQFDAEELRKHAFIGGVVPGPAMKIEFGIENWSSYRLVDKGKFARFRKVVKKHPVGWIVLDDLRYSRSGFPELGSFRFGPRTMRLVHHWEGIRAYRWAETTPDDEGIREFDPRVSDPVIRRSRKNRRPRDGHRKERLRFRHVR